MKKKESEQSQGHTENHQWLPLRVERLKGPERVSMFNDPVTTFKNTKITILKLMDGPFYKNQTDMTK